MSNLINQVQPSLEFIPPHYNPLLRQITALCLPAWLHWKTSIREIQTENVETLAHLYQEFDQKKTRFLLAFRHPQVDDPLCLGHLIWHILPKLAQQQKINLPSTLHSHFIYDRGIPLWAGQHIGWLYSRLGGTPIIRGKVDLAGLRSIRELFINGQFPMSAAPEGATNGHNELISPLEPGISQMAFWCMEDLQKANRNEQVVILPLGIQYRYIKEPWQAVDKLLTGLEIDTGLTTPVHNHHGASTISSLYDRLFRIGGHLLGTMEEFYRKFYHCDIPVIAPTANDNELNNQLLAQRLSVLLDNALKVAEEYFRIKPKGNQIDRCRRLEQAGWDYIYREDIKDIAMLSPLQRGLADRLAEEASLRMWHMRLVESFVAVTGSYVKEKPTVERFAETTLLLWDTIARIKGENAFNRPKLGEQRVKLKVGQPISVTARADNYKNNRRTAVAELTQDLQTALEGLIEH